MNVNDAQAVVTGAARGLGRSFALSLVREGARVVAGDVNAAGLRSLRGEVEGAEPGHLAVVVGAALVMGTVLSHRHPPSLPPSPAPGPSGCIRVGRCGRWPASGFQVGEGDQVVAVVAG